ncbi:hypothetical protein PybrP1_011265 [[Pythium] brassicae (nom. inval.)]|nr:hypothetical protein PybrP1_011265 [[Pythium] brassicae (nom. inval.)]
MSKTQWTRAEHCLLLRAWLEVAEDVDSSEKPSKAVLNERVFQRFAALSVGDCKRTGSAAGIQMAVLAFNFRFIVDYNLEHGANAWVSLDPTERADVYSREKTAAYNFVDLDPAMTQTMTRIRKHLQIEFPANSATSTSRHRVREKRKLPDDDVACTASATSFQAVIDEHRGAESTSDGDSSDADDHPSGYATNPKTRRLATGNGKQANRTRRTTFVNTKEMDAIMVAFRKTSDRMNQLTHRLEHLVTIDRRRQGDDDGADQSV